MTQGLRYPAEIVEHIVAFAALTAYGWVLKIGYSTEQMTLPFVQRGYTIVAPDQGV